MNKKGVIIISIVSSLVLITTVVLILILTKKQDKPIVEEQNIFSTPEYVYLSKLAGDLDDSDLNYIVDAAATLASIMSDIESNEKLKEADKQELRELYKSITSDNLVTLEEIEKIKNSLMIIMNEYSDDPDISKNLNKIKNSSYTFTQNYVNDIYELLQRIKANKWVEEGEYQELLNELNYLEPEHFVTYQEKLMKIIDKNQSTKGQILSLQTEQSSLATSSQTLRNELNVTIDTMVQNEIINEERAKQLKDELEENSVKVAGDIQDIIKNAQDDRSYTDAQLDVLSKLNDAVSEGLDDFMEYQSGLSNKVMDIFKQLIGIVSDDASLAKMESVRKKIEEDGVITEQEMNDLINSLRGNNIQQSVTKLQSEQTKYNQAMAETVAKTLKNINDILPKYQKNGEYEDATKASELLQIKKAIEAKQMVTADQVEEIQTIMLDAGLNKIFKDVDKLGDNYAVSTKALNDEITNLITQVNATFLGITKEKAKNIVKGDANYKILEKIPGYTEMITLWDNIKGKDRGAVSHNDYQKFQFALNALLTTAETEDALKKATNEANALANSAKNSAVSTAKSYTNQKVSEVNSTVTDINRRLTQVESENKALKTLIFTSNIDVGTINNNSSTYKGALGTFIDSGIAIRDDKPLSSQNTKLKTFVKKIAREQAENELNYRVTGTGIDVNNAQRTKLSEDKRIMLFEDAMKKVYPIGSIMIRYDSTNPNALPGLSGTTWVLISTSGNHALVAVDSSSLSRSGKTYNGAISNSGTFSTNYHTLTTSEIPSHSHSLSGSTAAAGAHSHSLQGTPSTAGAHTHKISTTTSKDTHKHNFVGKYADGSFNVVQRHHAAYGKFTDSWHYSGGYKYGGDDSEGSRIAWEYTPEGSISDNTHSHQIDALTESGGGHTHSLSGVSTSRATEHTHTLTGSTGNSGGSNSHNHGISLPSVFVAVWRRTA